MSNGLSQAEIDALLRGEETPGAADVPPDAGFAETVPEAPATGESAPPDASGHAGDAQPADPTQQTLTETEIDAMGELGNISMGTAATTLFALLSRRVDITTPRVSVTTMEDIARVYPMPFVAVEVRYTQGLEGTNVLFLRENDVKIITDLMLGGDGSNIPDELNDMHLSCISEVMNQMVGASSTSLAKLLNQPIDISPPSATRVDFASALAYPFGEANLPVVRIGFDMVVEGLINSEIMQVTPVPFAKSMVERLMGLTTASEVVSPPAKAPAAVPPPYRAPSAPNHPASGYAYPQNIAPPPQGYAPPPQDYAPPQGYAPPPGYGYAPPPGYGPHHVPTPPVDVRTMQFGSFDESGGAGGMNENMDILMDVPLSVSVELGKSRKHIREILDFNIGTIVVLDKMAGELVDVVVNGKLIAQGEVVVIDDSYGCRITDIISPSKRINHVK